MIGMNSTSRQSNARRRVADFPALANLRLEGEDLDALAHQGSLGVERRGDRTYIKLRFRREGRQQVRYVGGAERAEAVRGELETLQSDVQLRRRLAALRRIAASSLRQSKRALEPLLASRGYHFHGQAIRKLRNSPPKQVEPC